MSELELTVAAIDEDAPDYPRVEVRAANGRYCASSAVWLSLSQILQFADVIAGFPAGLDDHREYEIGHRDGEEAAPSLRWARGFCSFRFYTDDLRSTCIDVYVEDEGSPAFAAFTVHTEAAALDRFVSALRHLGGGSATLKIGDSAALVLGLTGGSS